LLINYYLFLFPYYFSFNQILINKSKHNLNIIIPCFNEEANIKPLIREWHNIIIKIGNDSKLVLIDDGSTDQTFPLLKKLCKKYNHLVILKKSNEGHGQTLLFGYKYAIEKNPDFIFQTDSDRQTNPDEFWQFWKKRNEFDLIIGKRINRKDGLERIFVSKILKLILLIIFKKNIEDANTPFRLIKTKTLNKYIKLIPQKAQLTNVLITVIFSKKNKNIKWIPITFKKRQKGKNSINFKKIIKMGFVYIKEFIKIKNRLNF